jgi:Transposase and inactivated derivatives
MARTYTTEFKEDCVRYCEGHPELDNYQKAEYLGVPYHTLYGWVRDYRRTLRAGSGEPVKGNLTPEEKEIARLKRENQDLQDALEILKKAISILGD